jgi:tRNA A37 threonylcarbamoyltransferase TsaD
MAKVKLDSKAVAQMLKSPEVEADLLARARRIATAAGPGMVALSSVGSTRARAVVITSTPEAMVAEQYHRALSSAIQAGA